MVKHFAYFCIASILASNAVVAVAAAQEAPLSVTPVVIDEKAKARDIIKQSVTLKNNTNRRLNVYPTVNDVRSADGEQAFVSALDLDDRAASLANWIELSRGVVELDPGEEKQIPFVIRVNLNAIAGTYHAQLSFTEGGDRASAEARGTLATVTVNLEVQADIKELMQLKSFATDNVFFSGDDVLFNFQLENIGNQDLQPKGEIRVYNRRGEEVASVPVNTDGKVVNPDQIAQMASVWSAVTGFGKFKAFLTIDYGRSQTASVQDTIYFWIIPWKQLLGIFVASLLAVIASAFYFHRHLEQKHMQRLAVAGVPGVHVAAVAPILPDGPAPKLRKRFSFRIPRPRIPIPSFLRKKPLTLSSVPVLTETSHEVHQEQVSVIETVSPTPVTSSSPIVAQPAPVAHTIDLKQMRSRNQAGTSTQSLSPQHDAQHGHVINLKRK